MNESRISFNTGRIFTPKKWAKWVIQKYGILEKWKQGSKIIDPTCGQGVFIHALIELSLERDLKISPNELSRITGIEINPHDKEYFLNETKRKYGIDFPADNFIIEDFFDYDSKEKFDIAVGNPPWINFSNLEESYKTKLKTEYKNYGLVRNKKDILLGASRSDLAALAIQKCMKDCIKSNGNGYFFIPLSLLFNEGANQFFRPKLDEEGVFSIEEIFDFEYSLVFPKVLTRNGFIAVQRGSKQKFPIKLTKLEKDGKSTSMYCIPTSDEKSWLQSKSKSQAKFPTINVEPHQNPRQGMNTCGLNKLFIFSRESLQNSASNSVGIFVNGTGDKFKISSEFMLPLLNNKNFGSLKPSPNRYILCLYNKHGSPLNYKEIQKLTGVEDYLLKFKTQMEARKGVLIQTQIKRGAFWALLGVGPYCFSKFKVAWMAFGKSNFQAKVVDGSFQGNQSMHAYIPSNSLADANRICEELNYKVPKYLSMFAMEGTCNWAQPGRIKRILQYD